MSIGNSRSLPGALVRSLSGRRHVAQRKMRYASWIRLCRSRVGVAAQRSGSRQRVMVQQGLSWCPATRSTGSHVLHQSGS